MGMWFVKDDEGCCVFKNIEGGRKQCAGVKIGGVGEVGIRLLGQSRCEH